MTTVRIAPEMHLVLDIDSATVAQENEGVLLYSLEPVVERLDKLDIVAEDLINSLSPSRPLLNSWPGREDTSYIAGFYTNAWYGIVVGFFFFGMVALLVYVKSLTGGGV
ncbi:MAG: tetrahydromethanopterin S-methyltransferase subunit [Euryarchaeota archaeon]|jgi:tetrahydromethanopterin S-methyltransferase subunit B|nr:tetrahydromethanopterin S-methyltransferase subunit [Euryarchaeota archaeon]